MASTSGEASTSHGAVLIQDIAEPFSDVSLLRTLLLDGNYKCTFCGYTTEFNEVWESHYYYHHRGLMYMCHFCTFRYLIICNLLEHMDIVHKTKIYYCEICKNMYINYNVFWWHLRDYHSTLPYVEELRLLQQTFVTNVNLNIYFICKRCTVPIYCSTATELFSHHKTYHYDESSDYPCPICPATFRTLTVLRMHKFNHYRAKLVYCNICDQKFSSKTSLDIHHNNHHKIEIYKCDKCEKIYKHKSSLNKHRKRTHDV